MYRQNLCGLIIGRRGCGKSSYLLELIEIYAQATNKPVIIYDTDDNDIYSHINTIAIEHIPALKKGVYKCIDIDYKKFIAIIRWKCWNKLIVFEDATKYLQYAYEDVYNTALASKQRNNDILFTFHSFRKVRPDFFDVANSLTLFKTGEQWTTTLTKKVPMSHLVKPVFDAVHKHPSKYYHQDVRIN